MSVVEQVLRGMLVVSGLLLPGAGWAFGARWPLPWFAAGVISVLAIFVGVFLLAVTGLPVTPVSLTLWLGVVGLTGAARWWRRRDRPGVGREMEGAPVEWWQILPAVPLLAVGCWRALHQPLSGVDVDFRWNHLAVLIVEHGGMGFYPPVSPDDFASYFWADGIAPLISGVYAWTYLAAGSASKIWTAIPVLMQLLGLLGLLQALARLWSPEARAGWLAVSLAGGTMLLQFAFNLGQETGFTALGVGGLAYYLIRWQREVDAGLIVPAALCAGLVACAREYGALYLLAAAVWIALQGRSPKSGLLFLSVGALLPVCWHLYVWAVTGNPVYAHDLGGWLSGNPVFSAWMRSYTVAYGSVFAQTEGWRELGRLLVISALPAVAGLIAGWLVLRRKPEAGLGALLVVAGLVTWTLSIPYTAGGLFYSMRVLSPLLLLGCAWGGAALAVGVQRRMPAIAVSLTLAAWSVDAGLRALTIPLNPYRTPVREWPAAGATYQVEFAQEAEAFVLAAVPHIDGRVLSDSAGLQYLFQANAKTLVPLWSPDVRFLFSGEDEGAAATRLRQLGYSHLLLKRAQSSIDFIERTGAWGKLNRQLAPVMANDTYILFALRPAPAS